MARRGDKKNKAEKYTIGHVLCQSNQCGFQVSQVYTSTKAR